MSKKKIKKVADTHNLIAMMTAQQYLNEKIGNITKKITKYTTNKDTQLTKAQERKNTPVYSGVLAYFPLVFGEIAKASLAGNKQHLEDQPLHWDRSKSTDQLDAGLRHIIDHARGELIDDDGVYHLAKAIWRLSAELELILENK